MEPNSQIIQVLKGLLVVCRASELGFLLAAETIPTRTAREILYTYADQRRVFTEEIRTLLRFHAGDWYDVDPPAPSIADSSFDTHSSQVIIQECERAEDAMLRVYEDALSRKYPWDIFQVLSSHYEQIKEARYFFHVFEKIHAPVAA